MPDGGKIADEVQSEGSVVSVSRRALRETSAEMEAVSDEAAVAGAQSVAEGEGALAMAVYLPGTRALEAGSSLEGGGTLVGWFLACLGSPLSIEVVC